MLSFLTEPAPHEEAAALIADKPAVMRELFDSLPDEMKSRAFTIKGIEDFDVLQSVRDQIAKIPQGAEWDHVKQDIIRKMSPWLDETQAATRAELLMRFHAGQAYATTSARIADSMIDVFPFRQYHTNHGPRVRDSHAALDGLILPADHEFWKTHTPPWQFNCHCFFTTLTEEDRDEAHAREQGRPPEARNVLEGPALDALAAGRVSRGPSQNYTLGKSIFHVDATTLPYDQIKKRWDTATAADFEDWAGKQDVGGTSLLEILKGNAGFREGGDPMGMATGGSPDFMDLARGAVSGKAFTSGGAPGLVSRMAAVDAEKVTAFEARHADKRIEHGLVFDKQGNTLWEDVGKADSVDVPAHVDLEGMGFSHNHPQGSSFSLEDVEVLFAKRAGEIRVTTSHGVFSVRRKQGVYHSTVEIRTKELAPDIRASLRALEGEADFDMNRYWDTLWRGLAQKGLIDYEYIPMKNRPQTPIAEALSARHAPAGEESITLRTPTSDEMRDYMDGKIPLPGLEQFSKTMRRLSIEAGEPQP